MKWSRRLAAEGGAVRQAPHQHALPAAIRFCPNRPKPPQTQRRCRAPSPCCRLAATAGSAAGQSGPGSSPPRRGAPVGSEGCVSLLQTLSGQVQKPFAIAPLFLCDHKSTAAFPHPRSARPRFGAGRAAAAPGQGQPQLHIGQALK